MAVDAKAPPIRSALLLSGLFDLKPLTYLPVGTLLGLADAAAVERMSPIQQKLRAGTGIAIALGKNESDEFKWQSAELGHVWNVAPPLLIDDANHFDLLNGLIEGELLNFARDVAR